MLPWQHLFSVGPQTLLLKACLGHLSSLSGSQWDTIAYKPQQGCPTHPQSISGSESQISLKISCVTW